jgi:hypothetical protein
MAAYEREMRRVQKAQEFDQYLQLNRQMVALGEVHMAEFSPAVAPVAPPADPVDDRAIRAAHERAAIEGIGWYRRAERRLAKQAVAEAITADIESEHQRIADAQRREQAMLNEVWQELLNNDPDRVLSALEAAFEDNEAPAAAIDCQGDAVTVVMRFADVETIVPDRTVTETAAGRPTTKKRTKTDCNELYTEILGSNVLATVKEALAVAPGINEVRVLAIRQGEGSRPLLTPLYAGSFAREWVQDIDWQEVHPVRAIEAADGLINYKGRTREVAALDLREEPELWDLVSTLAEQLEWQIDAKGAAASRR